MLNYVLNGKYSTLDAAYLPKLDEWMRIQNSTSWNLYADHAFLTISFIRDQKLMDPTKQGAYLVAINIKNEAEYFRGYIEPINRARWKELLKPELEKEKHERALAETEMRAQGIKIDEAYQDPPSPDFLKAIP